MVFRFPSLEIPFLNLFKIFKIYVLKDNFKDLNSIMVTSLTVTFIINTECLFFGIPKYA